MEQRKQEGCLSVLFHSQLSLLLCSIFYSLYGLYMYVRTLCIPHVHSLIVRIAMCA